MRLFLFLLIILFTFNLHAIVYRVLRPEIPYFDNENLIVGLITASIAAIIFGLTLVYIRRLEKTIDESKLLGDRLQSLILIDDLTGLCNRRGFFFMAKHQLTLAKRQRKKVLLLYGDLNDLKEINDKLGHKEGDSMLIETAHILSETFRDSDIIGRIGGDEFIVFSMDAREKDIDRIKERLQDMIDVHNSKRKNRYRLAISVGVLLHDTESGASFDEMISQTEKCMYKNKREIKKHSLSDSLKDKTDISPYQA